MVRRYAYWAHSIQIVPFVSVFSVFTTRKGFGCGQRSLLIVVAADVTVDWSGITNGK